MLSMLLWSALSLAQDAPAEVEMPARQVSQAAPVTASRPEVTREQITCGGRSGGQTLTELTSAIQDHWPATGTYRKHGWYIRVDAYTLGMSGPGVNEVILLEWEGTGSLMISVAMIGTAKLCSSEEVLRKAAAILDIPVPSGDLVFQRGGHTP